MSALASGFFTCSVIITGVRISSRNLRWAWIEMPPSAKGSSSQV